MPSTDSTQHVLARPSQSVNVARITDDPFGFRFDLLAWLPDASADELIATRHGLVDVAGFVKRHSRPGWCEALRAARLTEWEMARRWPPKDGTGRRNDDRPLLHASSKDNAVAWQRIYVVGRADREWLLTEMKPEELTQAAVMRTVQPDAKRFSGVRQGKADEVLADVANDSVDLVLTDPPYGDQARELYTWLGEFAARVLKPGGSLVVMTGQSRLPDDIERLSQADGLRYWWTLAFMHGASQRLPGIFVMAGWKPMLWYVKGHRAGRDMIGDVLRGKAYDKDEHEWAQGDGVRPVIEVLCPEGGLIVDPFAGTGQWGELAATLGREWIGADHGGAVVAQ